MVSRVEKREGESSKSTGSECCQGGVEEEDFGGSAWLAPIKGKTRPRVKDGYGPGLENGRAAQREVLFRQREVGKRASFL